MVHHLSFDEMCLPCTPQIAYRVTAYRVDSAYRVGFTWNQIILGIYIVRSDLILGRYSVTCRVD